MTKTFSIKINNDGSIVYQKINDDYNVIQDLISINFNDTIFTISLANNQIPFDNDNSFSVISKSYNNEIMLFDTLSLEGRTVFRDIKFSSKGNIIIVGFKLLEDLSDVSVIIIEYDKSLNLINFKEINEFYFNAAGYSYLKEDSNLLIIGQHFENNDRDVFVYNYNIYLDSIHSIKTYTRSNLNIVLPPTKSLTFSQKNFYIIGSTTLYSGGPFPAVEGGLLIKTDSVGNELWQKTYNRGDPDYSEFFKGIKSHPDGTLIVAGGTRDYSYTPTPSAPRGWLIKMDTEGNIIWERVLSRYHEFDWDDYVNDLILTSDGGIALAGYVIHNGIQDALGIYHRNDAWLVKTDSCGYTTGDVPEPLILVQSNQELTIQLQNATQNYCTATLTWGDDTEEQIYAYSQPIYGYSPNLTHTYTQPGTYQVCIEALAGEEFRTYCTEVVIEPNSLNSLPQGGGLGEGAKIYPNPTKNYFILEFPNHPPFGGSEGGYSLPFGEGWGGAYSPTGQLIHQFEIKPQLQQKIDISHLPEGVYIIKIETNQFSTSKKLVVVR